MFSNVWKNLQLLRTTKPFMDEHNITQTTKKRSNGKYYKLTKLSMQNWAKIYVNKVSVSTSVKKNLHKQNKTRLN